LRKIVLSALLALAAFHTPARAEYPEKPITIVIPSGPGGLTDLFVRLIGDELQKKWGQPVVMEHRAGAGGSIGAKHVADAAPDGYTILAGNNGPMTALPHLQEVPYDPAKDFVPVAEIASYASVILVKPDSKIGSLQDLTDEAKQSPGKIKYGSSGVGQSNHLGMELLQSATGTQFVHVPYQSGGAAVTDLMGGHVDVVMTTLPNVISQMKDGAVKAIAVTSADRNALFPDVATAVEQGVQGYVVTPWIGFFVPEGTSGEIVSKLHDAINEILAKEEVKAQYSRVGADIVLGSEADFRNFLAEEDRIWGDVISRIQK
jgi:tripartite-type tricarboxylate transporter receptor subunit TctC